ncbi:cobyric acid synthase [Bryobacter aggregatus]|uniref:cobyric acid synthase n=1 Tax=Bryobacter aggregatus TaxID=360054 RepID=UPI0005675C8E|nr:cobyric acid synthase [Bryobacter aggregatus]
MSRPLFIGGTASHVGKSWFTSAFCRLLARRGVRVAPFKGQNMSNNSYPTIEGGEIGRAQAVQAEACGVPPMNDMNPVLLKPNSATGSQVVVHGKVWKNVPARDYYTHSDWLLQQVLASYGRLATQFERIVCEGAGSIAEVNLRDRDITNLRLAEAIGADVVLVADIERGGVFASLVGTIELLPESQKRLIKAFAVNQFRGDLKLFDEGRRFLEERLQIPCLGVFPKDPAIRIAEEDSLGIEENSADSAIAVLRLPHISNFTDFRHLGPVEWLSAPSAKQYGTIFLPGTKNTIDDLLWLRAQGFDQWLRSQHASGSKIIGICGGYQMLGERIEDPEQLESTVAAIEGLGFLPVRTVLRSPKTTRSVQATTLGGHFFRAYEIHMGVTSETKPIRPFAVLEDGSPEGCRDTGVLGTYLHGAFEDSSVVKEELGVQIEEAADPYDALADWLIEHANPAVLEDLLR